MSILTIYIPTYNRANSLKTLLDSIINIKPYVACVVICDNNSDIDYVSGLDEEYQDHFKIIVNRRLSNIGARLNIISGIHYGFSKYTFMLGDDDIIDLEGIGDLINNLDFDFYVASPENLSGKIVSGKNVLRRNLYTIGNLGSFIFKSELIDKNILNALKYYDGNVWCTSWIYSKFIKSNAVGIYTKSFSFNPFHKSSMAKNGFYFATCLFHMRVLRRNLQIKPLINVEYLRFFWGNIYMILYCSAYLGDDIRVEKINNNNLSFSDRIIIFLCGIGLTTLLFKSLNIIAIMVYKRISLFDAILKIKNDTLAEISKRNSCNIRTEKDFF